MGVDPVCRRRGVSRAISARQGKVPFGPWRTWTRTSVKDTGRDRHPLVRVPNGRDPASPTLGASVRHVHT